MAPDLGDDVGMGQGELPTRRSEEPLVRAITRLLSAHGVSIGILLLRRSMSCTAQAVLLLRFMRQRAAVTDLARDNTVSLKTPYRYLHEAFDVLAAQAPDLPEVITAAVSRGTEHLLLDGTLIEHDRTGLRDRWYSGKHRHHSGLGQVVTDADGWPLWVSPLEPGCTHDLTAARIHALLARYPAARDGVPTLADRAHTGAGAGIRVPVRRPKGGQVLDQSTRGWNSYVNCTRAFVEHGIGHLKTRWRALRHVSLCPWRISAMAATTLVLSRLENRY